MKNPDSKSFGIQGAFENIMVRTMHLHMYMEILIFNSKGLIAS
jgi:hypothetical protein